MGECLEETYLPCAGQRVERHARHVDLPYMKLHEQGTDLKPSEVGLLNNCGCKNPCGKIRCSLKLRGNFACRLWSPSCATFCTTYHKQLTLSAARPSAEHTVCPSLIRRIPPRRAIISQHVLSLWWRASPADVRREDRCGGK